MTNERIFKMIFTGMDVCKELSKTLNDVKVPCCMGMSDSEKKAYQLGIDNCLSLLKSLFDDDSTVVVNVDNLEIPEEFMVEDLEAIFDMN